jgi:hypothetical protein
VKLGDLAELMAEIGSVAEGSEVAPKRLPKPLPYDHPHFPLMLPDWIYKTAEPRHIRMIKLSKFE